MLTRICKCKFTLIYKLSIFFQKTYFCILFIQVLFLQEEEKDGLYLCKKHKIQNQKPSRWKSVSDENQMMVQSSSSVRFRNRGKSETASNEADVELEETIWLKNDEIHEHSSQLRETDYTTNRSINNNKKESKFIESNTQIKEVAIRPDAEVELNLNAIQCKTRNDLVKRKFIVAEWQRIATVVDRVLFWFYFLGTLASYLIILVFVPNSKYSEWSDAIDDVNDVDIDTK